MFLKLFLSILICLTSNTQSLFSANTDAQHPTNKWPTTHAYAVWRINSGSIPHESRHWSTWTMEEYAIQLWENTSNPLASGTRQLASHIFQSHQANLPDGKGLAQLTNEQLWNDLSLFCGQKNKSHYAAKAAIPTQTELGITNSCIMLSVSTTNIALLTSRQSFIKTVAEQPVLHAELEKIISTFAQHEHILLQFWDEQEHLATDLQRSIYFDKEGMLSRLNDNEIIMQLELSSIVGTAYSAAALQAFAAAVLGIYGAAKLFNVDMPANFENRANRNAGAGGLVAGYAWEYFENNQIKGALALAIGTYCGHNASKSLGFARGMREYIKTYSKIIHHTALSIRALHNLILKIKQHDLLDHPMCAELKAMYAKPEVKELFRQTQGDLFNQTEDGVTNFLYAGRLISFLQVFFQNKKSIEEGLVGLGQIDTLTACVKNITQQPDKWCLTEFATGAHPYIIAKDFWHPLVLGNPVANDLTLGCDGHRPHVILTGANAGGKSTTMKAVATAIVFSQTLGISPATSFIMTPFKHIQTHLNIRDDIGIGNSLFMAETVRAMDLLKTIKNAAAGEFIICFFDEMFNSTTPIEGCGSAYSLAQELTPYTNCLCMIATHFIELTELATTTDMYTNMNVSVIKLDDGTLAYPFKIQPGISHQHIALDILRNEGFSGSFIDRAEQTVRRIEAKQGKHHPATNAQGDALDLAIHA